MNDYNKIEKLIKKNNGILYATDIEKNDINRYYVRKMIEDKYIKRVLHGIYALIDKNINEFWLMNERYKKGIFSHNTALYFHELTDRTPLKLDMTFPSNIRVNDEYLRTHYIKPDKHELGLTTMEIEPGVKITLYNVERTICDIIRDKNKIDPQTFNTALKEYSKIKYKKLHVLYKYAKEFNIELKLQQYMEVLN